MSSIWPFFGLRIRTPRLELRYPSDEDLIAVAAVAAEGIHEPDAMPFTVPWTRKPSPELERGVLQFVWSRRASLTRDDWGLPFVVVESGAPVGIQDLFAKNFGVTRSVETGSWLVRRAQGRGIGKEMRSAVLHLAFAGLDAAESCTASFSDNLPSEGVTRSLGYAHNGTTLVAREGVVARTNKWVLTREQWVERQRGDITVEGLDACRELLDSAYTT